ncbi:MAG: hypothetical protein Tsb009_03180 [Planctomycetaceae bacterium]
MYKLLLCLRYLRTRYIALASIISVMLGVATMIVVNSVMAGFSSEMRERIHGILADVIVETTSLDGTPDVEKHMAVINRVAGDNIEAMTATVEVYGMLSFRYHGQWVTRPITLIGINPEEKAKVSPLTTNLDSYRTIREKDPNTGKMVTVREPLRSSDIPPGWTLTDEAKKRRIAWIQREQYQGQQQPLHGGGANTPDSFPPPNPEDAPWKRFELNNSPSESNEKSESPFPSEKTERKQPAEPKLLPDENEVSRAPSLFNDPPPAEWKSKDDAKPKTPVIKQIKNETPQSPAFEDDQSSPNFSEEPLPGQIPAGLQNSTPFEETDPTAPLEGRVYIGMGLISFPFEDPKTGRVKIIKMVLPGDDVKISTVNAGRPPEAVHFNATVVDVFKSGMSEYDSNLVFCNLEYLQKIRGMVDPMTGARSITSIQIKLKDYSKAEDVVKRLKATFPPGLYTVRTWEQKQGPLLAAVEVESAILNVLLFLIIAVAGFGILAIFFMIVVEKTRDIGILKALGAGSNGVMSIFLSYGLALGIVGSGVGVILGLMFVRNINTIESWITWITGRKVFDEKIYYFPEIPTQVNPMMVVWVAIGAMAIAVLASVLPARRAARFHPVEALRYE